MLQTVKCRVERALLYLQHVTRQLPDTARNRPAMLALELQRFQNQEIKRALDEVDGFDTCGSP